MLFYVVKLVNDLINLNLKKMKITDHIHPNHSMVSSFCFEHNEDEELNLCDAMARVAEKNGLSANDMQHLFPDVLRMLKSDIPWSGVNKDKNNIKP